MSYIHFLLCVEVIGKVQKLAVNAQNRENMPRIKNSLKRKREVAKKLHHNASVFSAESYLAATVEIREEEEEDEDEDEEDLTPAEKILKEAHMVDDDHISTSTWTSIDEAKIQAAWVKIQGTKPSPNTNTTGQHLRASYTGSSIRSDFRYICIALPLLT